MSICRVILVKRSALIVTLKFDLPDGMRVDAHDVIEALFDHYLRPLYFDPISKRIICELMGPGRNDVLGHPISLLSLNDTFDL